MTHLDFKIKTCQKSQYPWVIDDIPSATGMAKIRESEPDVIEITQIGN